MKERTRLRKRERETETDRGSEIGREIEFGIGLLIFSALIILIQVCNLITEMWRR